MYAIGIASISVLLAACSSPNEEKLTIDTTEDIISGEQQMPTSPGVEGTAENTPTESTGQPVPVTTEEESPTASLTDYQKYILFE